MSPTQPHRAALTGIVLALPFVLLNLTVVFQLEPLFSLLRPETHTTLPEQIMLFASLFLIFLGGVVALRPLFYKPRTFLFFNAVIGTVLIVISVLLIGAFGIEVYRCDVLKELNCD